MIERRRKRHSLRFNRSKVLSGDLLHRQNLLPSKSNLLMEREKDSIYPAPCNPRHFGRVPSPGISADLQDAVYGQLAEQDVSLAALALLTTLVAVLHNEDLYENENELTPAMSGLRILQILLTGFSLLTVHQKYQMVLTSRIMEQKISPTQGLWRSQLWKSYVLELLLFSPVCIPFVEYTFTVEVIGHTIEYSLNSLLTFLTTLRLYSLVWWFGHITPYTRGRAHKVCAVNGESASLFFAVKCTLMKHPNIVALTAFFFISIFSAFCLCLNERPDRIVITDGVETANPSLVRTYTDCLWLIFVSSTTVGYGDIYPTTHLGRAIIFAVAIVGNMCLGLLTTGLVIKTEHSDEERNMYNAIVRAERNAELRDRAARVLQHFCRQFSETKAGQDPKTSRYTAVVPLSTMQVQPRRLNTRHFLRALSDLAAAKAAAQEAALPNNSELLNYIGDRLAVGLGDINLKIKSIAGSKEILQLSDVIQQQHEIAELSQLALHNSESIKQLLDKRKAF